MTPRKITAHITNPCNAALTLEAIDEPGAGGANHAYRVTHVAPNGQLAACHIDFQNGPIKEKGANGLTQEVLIAICIDRLQCFQKGPFACKENEMALIKLEDALAWLATRTTKRERRGVEGTHTP
jgi:hypothetical protein